MVGNSSLSTGDWEVISKEFNERTLMAADIAVLQGFSLSNLRANVGAGMKAVLHNVSVEEAKGLFHEQNLNRFVEMCDECRKECMSRIAALSSPQRDDVDRVHVSVRLRMDENLAKPVRGEALAKLERLHEEFIAKLLHFLHIDLGKKPVQANAEQVAHAFSDSVDHSWLKQHRVRHYALLGLQAVGLVLMSTHTLASGSFDIAMLTAGILIGVFVLFYLGKKP
jgi:hypothetical protein